MKDILIAAGVLGVVWWIYKKSGSTPLVATQTPAPPVPYAPSIGGQIIVGDSYGVPPWGTTITNGGASSPLPLPSTISSPPGFPPPAGVSGGIAGGGGTGGSPLGGPLTPGVSTGTGTTLSNGLGGVAPVDIFGRGRPGAPGYDVWGRPLGN